MFEHRCSKCWSKLDYPVIDGPYGIEQLGPWCSNPIHSLGLLGIVLEAIMGYKWVHEHKHAALIITFNHVWPDYARILKQIGYKYLIPPKVKLRREIIKKLSSV